MKPKDIELAAQISDNFSRYEQTYTALPGIAAPENRACLIEQILESIHRIEFIERLEQSNREISQQRGNPRSDIFDPYRAAILFKREGNIDEACWLIFLAVHFGKHEETKWALPRAVYGSLEQGITWTWDTVVANPGAMSEWVADHAGELSNRGKFSNHRAYLSFKETHTGRAIKDYVGWAGNGHRLLFNEALHAAQNDPGKAFDALYKAMKVNQFGRLAKFDYLTLIGKLRLALIEPSSTYIGQATGPKRGAKLLFGGSTTADIKANILESRLKDLQEQMNFHFGMQVLEDSLCNWQKSPSELIRFRG